ncbi:MAG: amino acid racemase [Clostridiales bacterium]|nr:amino acid racemase [Clostridiales bacterium]
MTKVLGVIGGLGPLASAYFYKLITIMTEAEKDQEHLEVIVYSKPSIPDRTAYILGKTKESPLPPMLETGRRLVDLGAEHIAIPCITAHYFYDSLSRGISAPIIHAIKETRQVLEKNGVKRAGLLATEGTIVSRIFQSELELGGISTILPDSLHQTYVMDLIYEGIKANHSINFDKFLDAAKQMKKNGAEILILGCTELSLIKSEFDLGKGYLDVMEVLAKASILKSGANIKKKYLDLL